MFTEKRKGEGVAEKRVLRLFERFLFEWHSRGDEA